MNITKFMFLEEQTSNNGEAIITVNVSEFRKLKDYKELYVHILKVATAAVLKSKENNREQYTVKAYLDNIELKNADSGFIGQLVTNLQDLFPNRLGSCYLYYPPKIFMIGWAFVNPFLDPITKSKFFIITKDGQMKINDYEDKFKDRI